ncbi:hypothetical protein Bbelb_262320 [Branchiostoma belcheri]|nr:hypothetical protein Bbelb_262320 [Branchiostoma belcheri]
MRSNRPADGRISLCLQIGGWGMREPRRDDVREPSQRHACASSRGGQATGHREAMGWNSPASPLLFQRRERRIGFAANNRGQRLERFSTRDERGEQVFPLIKGNGKPRDKPHWNSLLRKTRVTGRKLQVTITSSCKMSNLRPTHIGTVPCSSHRVNNPNHKTTIATQAWREIRINYLAGIAENARGTEHHQIGCKLLR